MPITPGQFSKLLKKANRYDLDSYLLVMVGESGEGFTFEQVSRRLDDLARAVPPGMIPYSQIRTLNAFDGRRKEGKIMNLSPSAYNYLSQTQQRRDLRKYQEALISLNRFDRVPRKMECMKGDAHCPRPH